MKESYLIVESSFEENRVSERKEKTLEVVFGVNSSPEPSPINQGVCFSSISMSVKLMNFQKNQKRKTQGIH